MRYGHSRQEIIGVTLKPEAVKTWVYSLHSCHTILNNLNAMRSDQQISVQNSRKEETPRRIKVDRADKKNLRNKLKLCIDPLDTTKLSDGLVNVVTGHITNYATVLFNSENNSGTSLNKAGQRDFIDPFRRWSTP